MANPNNSLAARGRQGGEVRDFDDRGVKFTTFINGNAIKKLLTQSLGGPQQAAQLTSTLIAVVQGNPKLQKAAPMEILAGALRGEIGMGLSLILGDYSIIPYENWKDGSVTAQFQLQVNGIKRMCVASGAYEKINCYEVREGEFKGYDRDTWEPIVERNPNDELREQLPIVGYYAFYRLNKKFNGFTSKVYWPYEKILNHANRYSKAFDLNIWKAIQDGATKGTDSRGKPWTADGKRAGSPWYGDPTDEAHMKMCRKTVLKQLLSDGFAPKSTVIQQAIAADDAEEKSDEPVYYGDEFDRMAKEAAIAAAQERPSELPQTTEQEPAHANDPAPAQTKTARQGGRKKGPDPKTPAADYEDMTSNGLPFDMDDENDPFANL